MLVLAIAIGVFGIGSILGGYSVIKREMTDNYISTVPASATIEIEGAISKELVDSVKQFPGIAGSGTARNTRCTNEDWRKVVSPTPLYCRRFQRQTNEQAVSYFRRNGTCNGYDAC